MHCSWLLYILHVNNVEIEVSPDYRTNKYPTSHRQQTHRPIELVNSVRLLGVTLTADLKWRPHIDEITAKASQQTYFIILLNRAGVEPHHLVKIYTTLVRYVVEYACQVWHTSLTKQQTKQLESIQRRAMRIIFRNVTYAEAIVTAGIPTLADRRETLYRTLFTSNSLITSCIIFLFTYVQAIQCPTFNTLFSLIYLQFNALNLIQIILYLCKCNLLFII